MLEGEYQRYINGKLFSKGNYRNDKLDGEWIYNDTQTGEPLAKDNYKDGVIMGECKQYLDSTDHVVFVKANASIYRIITYDGKENKKCKATDYYLTGEKQWEGTITGGKPDGFCTYYYKNGKKQMEGVMIHDANNDGIKDYRDGKWLFLFESGKIYAEIVYKYLNQDSYENIRNKQIDKGSDGNNVNREIISAKIYDESGKLVQVIEDHILTNK